MLGHVVAKRFKITIKYTIKLKLKFLSLYR